MIHEVAIIAAAARNGLDPKLVMALVMVESGGNQHAWNPEPAYRYFWDVRKGKPFRFVTALEARAEVPPEDFGCLAGDPDQEWWAQQASWGLMQVMGALARELGFKGPYLPELCSNPEVNLSLGCLHLGRLMKWAAGNADRALSAYNGGKGGNLVPPYRNQDYATKVLAMKATL